jgi:hypothetical protein
LCNVVTGHQIRNAVQGSPQPLLNAQQTLTVKRLAERRRRPARDRSHGARRSPPLLYGRRLRASVCLALYIAFWLELSGSPLGKLMTIFPKQGECA